MKRADYGPTVLAILVWGVVSAGVAFAQRANGASKLMVTVTVPPICTVAVTAGALSAENAIDVRCRNLPREHPQPVVSEAPVAMVTDNALVGTDAIVDGAAPRDANPDAGAEVADDPVTMVVINF
jgi:hypothetical protein